MEEVSKHCTQEDCWMVFNGVVYDVTEYLNFHPGGYYYIKKIIK